MEVRADPVVAKDRMSFKLASLYWTTLPLTHLCRSQVSLLGLGMMFDP